MTNQVRHLLWLLFFTSFAHTAESSFLANFETFWNTKHTFQRDETIDLLVNTATSQVTGDTLGYYRLPFVCPNSSNAKPVHLSLAEIINGDRFWQSDYHLSFLKDEPCLRICDRVMNQGTIERSVEVIKNDYIANWVVDGIPASTTFISDDGLSAPKKYYIPGFSLGYMQGDDAYINNHVMIVIRYHKESDDPEKYSIVGVEVYPKSVNGAICPGASKDFQHLKLTPEEKSQLIPFTYSIYWREDPEVEHKNRWKMYIDPSFIDERGNVNKSSSNSTTIHWVSLINSFVMLSFVSIIVAFVLLTTFRSNFASDTASEFSQIAQNSFSRPIFLNLLSILTGSGIQLIFTLLGSGLLSFVFFGNTFGRQTTIFSAVIAVLIIGGFFAGFSSIQLYKLFSKSAEDLNLKKTIIISSLSGSALMTLSLIVVVITNVLVFDPDSPRSIKFGTFMFLFLVYVILQIPISVIGGIISKHFNLLTNLLAKKIPEFSSASVPMKKSTFKQSSSSSKRYPLYLRFPFSLLILGIIPCSIVFIESRFLYVTLLVERASATYFMYGFIISAAILLLVVMVEIGIVATYLRLLNVNSQVNWQWWTFLTCSFSIWIYLVPLSIYHLVFKMKLIDSGSPVLYMVYTTILNTIVSIACGSLALWSATMFVYAVVYSAGTKED